ncbi:MAG: hypothetical protein HC914_09870 [Chloroflexaceae bacterium]|nr:hypothetical protein [Chloroflexaceae bacterium]
MLFRDYRLNATLQHQAVLIVRAPEEWVTWRRTGRTTYERARNEQTLAPGDRLRIASSAGYGQAATIVLFDQSALDLWAGADLELRQMETTRWSNRAQVIQLQQNDGYVRYDLQSSTPYEQTIFRVAVPNATVELAPGGSYSIALMPGERRVLFPNDNIRIETIVDVAVRSGMARIQGGGETVVLQAGERSVIDPAGIPSAALPALWNLIKDTNFNQYSEEEYNNTTITDQPMLIRSNTWQVYSGPPGADATGFFKLANTCPPPQITGNCAPEELEHAAWLCVVAVRSKALPQVFDRCSATPILVLTSPSTVRWSFRCGCVSIISRLH